MNDYRYPVGKPYDYPLTLNKLLNTPLRFAPQHEIVFLDRMRYDYRTLAERVNRLASGLEAHGARPGDTIAVLEYNSHRYLECLFAIPMTGAVLHTVNWRLAHDHLAYILEHAGVDIIIAHADHLPTLEKVRHSLRGVKKIIAIADDKPLPPTDLALDCEYEQLLTGGFRSYDFPDLDERTPASLFYTAGTSGKPKGVSFTHRQLVLHTMSLGMTLGSFASPVSFRTDDVYLPLTPMYHEHAWGGPFLATMLGAKQVYAGRYNPETVLDLIVREEVTFTHSIPTVLHMLINHPHARDVDLSSWKVLLGGARLTPELARAIQDRGIRVCSAFGMSETCPMISVANLTPELAAEERDQQLEFLTSAGQPAPLVELEVVDPQGHPQPHDGHTTGEVVMRSPWLTEGYYKDPEKSKDLWRDGWLYSGDVGYISPEGYLHITDRIKDVIKTGGEWISAHKIEKLIRKHKSVVDAAVIGMPDEKWGERPVVLVVLTEEMRELTTEDDLKEFMRHCANDGQLPAYGIPDRYLIIDEIPKTGVRKIDFRTIRDLLE